MHKSIKRVAIVGVLLSSLGACSNMNMENLVRSEPVFDFISYFSGHTRASGWFSDRFGNVRRHFCGDFYGKEESSGFVLNELLYYTDGIKEERVWVVNIDENGGFIAESESLIGGASGQLKGNSLAFNYKMKVAVAPDGVWHLSMDDYMFLQADGSLHNMTNVKKWGVRIGTVTTQYERHDGTRLCSDTPLMNRLSSS